MTTAERQRSAQELIRPQLPAELTQRGECPFDPATGLTELSGRGRIHRIEHNDEVVWLVTGHDEARAVLSDPRMSSDRINSPRARRLISPELHAKMFPPERRAGSFIFMDAPEHTRYRKLLTGQFTVRRMRDLAPRVLEIVTAQLDAMIEKGAPADLVHDFALPVPSLVICELLGVDYGDREEFQRRTSKLLSLKTTIDEQIEVGNELRAFMQGLVREKQQDPGDDLLSGLIRDTDLTEEELVGIANLLLIAGHETTANNISLGVVTLLQQKQWIDDDRAIEELLRYHSVADLVALRVAVEDVEIGGQLVRAGEGIVPLVAGANHDPEMFERPHEFDPSRSATGHVAFGYGVHQCLGQNLVRLEMDVAYRGLFRRIPALEVAVPLEELRFKYDGVLFGLHALPVRW
jgi:cytochrome P450